MWRQKVRSARIRDINDPPGTTGVLDLETRRGFINQLTTIFTQKIALQDISKRKPMNKGQFIAHLRYKEGVLGLETEPAQDKHWSKVLASRDTTILSGQGDSAVILVDKGRVIHGLRERSFESNVRHQTALESQQEAEAAMAQVVGTGAGSGALSSAIFGSAGQ